MDRINWDFIKDIAGDVYKELGVGHPEAAYRDALVGGLHDAGYLAEAEVTITMFYKTHPVNEMIVDVMVIIENKDQRIGKVVEIKATSSLKEADEAQGIKYVRGAKKYSTPMADVIEAHPLVMNFPQVSGKKIKEEDIEVIDGVQYLNRQATE